MPDQQHPTFANGKICYIEIPSRDVIESSSFYHNVFKWIIRTRDDGSVAFDDTVTEVSGTWRLDRKAVADPGILIHIMVEDIEATVQSVKDHGGTIVQDIGKELPEITARFKDPSGNVFGLFQQAM